MLKINELKEGDLVMVEYDGQWKEGEITDVDRLDGKVEVTTVEDQAFWYDEKHLKPILLDESYLFKLGFQKQQMDNGEVKYTKGAFRTLLHQAGNFSNFEMWYREDKRHITHPIYVHEFQNNFLAMTKVPLAKGE
jgi:hypothetical protein